MMWNAKFEGWECIEAGRQLRAAEETGRARIAAARKRRRDEERNSARRCRAASARKYRKWAKEGDAMAVAFLRTRVCASPSSPTDARPRLSETCCRD